jgi:hypothetical protein
MRRLPRWRKDERPPASDRQETNIGHTDAGRGWHGYTAHGDELDSLTVAFPHGGWVPDKDIRSTGGKPGKPPTAIRTLDATSIYVMDIFARDVLPEYEYALSRCTTQEQFDKALVILTKVTLARAPAANPRVMEQSDAERKYLLPLEEEGQMFLGQLDHLNRIEKNQLRMENKIDHYIATQDVRAIQVFRAMGELDDGADLSNSIRRRDT